MFETAEVGRKLSKKAFKALEGDLRTRLLAAQRQLRERGVPVIIIVSGVEGAGKGSVVARLSEWMDTRGLITHAFWNASGEEQERPAYWRFWRALPPRGSISMLFGSWYSLPIIDRVFGRIDDARLDRELTRIRGFERMLHADGALIVKFWFHLSKDAQHAALQADRKRGAHSPLLKSFARKYEQFARVSERALRLTDTSQSPWYIVESQDSRYRDMTVGETLLRAIDHHLLNGKPAAAADVPSAHAPALPAAAEAQVTVLDRVPLDRSVERADYERRLSQLQRRVARLSWAAYHARVNTVCVFEGWDAAGKGGAIRRITRAIDARLYRVISIAAPTDEERAHHYLWRFWRHVPRAGYLTIYDRSWYGRVLVERVEGFADRDAWGRAYQEINLFEEQLCEHGAVLLKFWLHIDADEQLRRFREREVTPWKQHKITADDWRNRERWGDYERAVNDLVGRTSTGHAPWTLVAANDKKAGRLQVLEQFCQSLEARLETRRES